MNLFLEYLIRSGELQCNLEFPYSLFVTNHVTNDKIAIVINEVPFSGQLIVRHWRIGKCARDQVLPDTQEYSIRRDDLFQSTKVIIPNHCPLWYREEMFESGRMQHSDSPMAERDEKEYNTILSNVLNSQKHKNARAKWLWRAFSSVYDLDVKSLVPAFREDYQETLKSQAPHLVGNWILWRKYMLDFSTKVGQIAGELLFHKEYAALARNEGRAVGEALQRGYVNPWCGSNNWYIQNFLPSCSGTSYVQWTGSTGAWNNQTIQ